MRESHRNRQALYEAIEARDVPRVREVIDRDPLVLADFDSRGWGKEGKFHPLAYAIALDDLPVAETLINAITEHQSALLQEIQRQGRDGDLYLSRPYQPVFWERQPDGMVRQRCLTEFVTSLYRSDASRVNRFFNLLALNQAYIMLHEGKFLPVVPAVSSLLAALDAPPYAWETGMEELRQLRREGVDLNASLRPGMAGKSLPENLQIEFRRIGESRLSSRPQRLGAYCALADEGVDLRPLLLTRDYDWWDTPAEARADPAAYVQEEKDALLAYGRKRCGEFLQGKAEALHAVCATGQFPLLQRELARRGDSALVEAVEATVDPYWRSQYPRSLIALRRIVPQEPSALEGWVRR